MRSRDHHTENCYCPVAVAPQVTVEMTDDGALIDGRTIPAPVSVPITPMRVSAVQDGLDETARFKTAPTT